MAVRIVTFCWESVAAGQLPPAWLHSIRLAFHVSQMGPARSEDEIMQDSKKDRKWHILWLSKELSGDGREAAALCQAGWRVLRVSDPVEAFSTVESQEIDLVVLHLPVDDAIDTALPTVLRSVSSAEYLPVIIVAASATDRERCQYLDSGADDVISGEISPAEMISRLRALLRIKGLHDRLAASREALAESLNSEHRLLTKLRRDKAHLQLLCTTDPLTHVQNARSFRDILQHQFRIARRYGHCLSLLTLDVDHFKVVNDTHGHPSGNYVLKELAVIFKQSIRDSDVVARTGGEEFSVILVKAGRKEAAALAERILKEVRQRQFIVYGCEIHVTVSIGSATYPADADTTEPDMLEYFADQALLEAKESGRDRVVAVHELSREARRRIRRQYQEARDSIVQMDVNSEPSLRPAHIDSTDACAEIPARRRAGGEFDGG